MGKRVILAGVLGGLTLFAWGAASHMLLGLGDTGMSFVPEAQEPALLAQMKASVPGPGFYFFPGFDEKLMRADKAKEEAWMRKYKEGPAGILIMQPTGQDHMTPMTLGREALSNILVAVILAMLVAPSRLTRGQTVMMIMLIGVIAGVETNFSYWNWYGFPGNYTVAQIADVIVGYTLMGTVIALVARPKS